MPKSSQKIVQVWNQYDEFGLMAGLGHWTEDGKSLKFVRLPGETNIELRNRILKSYGATRDKLINSSHQGLVNAISRDLGLETYVIKDKNIFYLSQEPHPTGQIKVYVSGVSDTDWAEWTPQIRSSGYQNAVDNSGSYPSGWIVWNLPDYSGDNHIHNGEYTQILEFINYLEDKDEVRVEYEILDRYDERGNTVMKLVSDFDNHDNRDDDRFREYKDNINNK